MKIKTNVKAGGITFNHNQSAVKAGLPVKTQVKAGQLSYNHNQTLVANDKPTRGWESNPVSCR